MSFKFAAAVCGVAMGIALTVGAALADPSAAASPAAAPVQAAPAPKIDPQADALLTKTCEALGSADAFSFHAEIMFDQVLPHQVKVQYAAEMNFALQRPDSLMVDYHSDLGGKQLWYQGDTLTIFDQPHAVYASMKVPTSIDAMLDEVTQTEHLTLPLSNLAYSDPCATIRKAIIYGTYIGVNDVNGVDSDHIAASSSNVDFELWRTGRYHPLVQRRVTASRFEPGSIQYFATKQNWKLAKPRNKS